MNRWARLAVPLLVGAGLFVLWAFLERNRSLIDDLHLEPLVVLDLIRFVALLPVIFVIVRALDLLIFDIVVARHRVRAPVLLREIASIGLFVIGLTGSTWAIFQYNVTTLLATGTVVAAVLGLALQETLGNLFSGIAMHLEDSFEVGDVVRTGEIIGVVETVRWRATRIRTFNNNLVIVPNSILGRDRLEIFPRHNLNARILQIGIDYHAAPATVIDILTQAATNVEGVSHDLPCFARVGGFAESALTYEIKYFTSDYSQRDRIDADIRKAVWYALRRNGVTIPYPIRMFQKYAQPEHRADAGADEIVERLAHIDVLSPLPAKALAAIAGAARAHVYSRGETIIRRGSEGSSMFIVHDGSVSVRVADQQVEREIARLGAGDFFGEMALLTGETRAADVVALNDVVAVEITKEALQPILQDHPELAAELSSRVMDRRESLESALESREQEQQSILSRIRSYFGL